LGLSSSRRLSTSAFPGPPSVSRLCTTGEAVANAPPLPVECCPLLPWASRSVVCPARPVTRGSYGLPLWKPQRGLLVHPRGKPLGQQPPSPMVLIDSTRCCHRAEPASRVPKDAARKRRPTWIAPSHPLCSLSLDEGEDRGDATVTGDHRRDFAPCIHDPETMWTGPKTCLVQQRHTVAISRVGLQRCPNRFGYRRQRPRSLRRLHSRATPLPSEGRIDYCRLSTRHSVTRVASTRVVERSHGPPLMDLHQP